MSCKAIYKVFWLFDDFLLDVPLSHSQIPEHRQSEPPNGPPGVPMAEYNSCFDGEDMSQILCYYKE